MYPFFRMAKELWVHRKDPPIAIGEAHVSCHICWPWDLDFWMELNNGRTLTLYDLGRIPMARRMGLVQALRENGWGLTVAGVSVRYRARVRLMQRFEMRSRALGWDARFFYLDQSIWLGGKCANQALYRVAATSAEGIVPPARVAVAMGQSEESPTLPEWVRNWIAAEATRPWPPAR